MQKKLFYLKKLEMPRIYSNTLQINFELQSVDIPYYLETEFHKFKGTTKRGYILTESEMEEFCNKHEL